MLDLSNTETRFIKTPLGQAWMFGFDQIDTVTVQFQPDPGKKVGSNRAFNVSECEEIDNEKT